MFSAHLQDETGIMEPSNEDELLSISQPLDEFILATSFNRRVLHSALNNNENNGYAHQEEVWNPIITSYGLCYTFQTSQRIYRPGSDAGLEVLLWIGQENYQATTTEAGVRVFVTPPTMDTNNNNSSSVLISDQASQVLVSPGKAAFVQLDLQEFEREQEEPWKRCATVEADSDGMSTTNEVCRTECMYAATRSICGCRQIGDPNGGLEYKYCNGSIVHPPSTLTTTSIFEQRYHVTYSGAATIANAFGEMLEMQMNVTEGSVDDNLVSVTINYGSIQYDKTTESKATSYSGLISDLGGQLGFFMGISIISIAELLVELIGLRLLPRWLFGRTQLYGVGQQYD
ncbi:MAG: hypothetical protein SGARI_003604 [Bacillariaceae sp.]